MIHQNQVGRANLAEVHPEWVHPEDLVSLPERRDARAEPIDFSFDDDAEHASASDPESEDQTGRDAEHGLDIAET